jgi:hypothetical protein
MDIIFGERERAIDSSSMITFEKALPELSVSIYISVGFEYV